MTLKTNIPIRHHQNYGKGGYTLCDRKMDPILRESFRATRGKPGEKVPDEIAVALLDIKEITCELCKTARVGLALIGRWPNTQ